MNISYLTSNDWECFKAMHPSGYKFLLSRSLTGEQIALENELTYTCSKKRQAWIQNRLEELGRLLEGE